ncbi:MAG: wax ester/triacylglycerol synthase family O-acyltransferase, partial [Gammaproteobacteria bacterium]|nr:wax ester/triacylglycerol synthase family O-acyltransferase [Gammaproteobacteria bacterium]
MEQLTGIDASFVFLESTRTPMHIGGVLFCKAPPGGFNFEDYVRLIESRLGKSKVFRRRLVSVPLGLDAPYWIEDPHFNLDSHVHHMALPSPGGWGELRKLAQHIFAIPLDLRRPLWSMTFVEGLGGINQLPEGSFALIHKMHHAAVDGMGSVDLVSSLFDLSRKVDLRVHEDRWMPDMEPSNLTLLANAYMHLLAKPKLAVKTIKAVTAGMWSVGKNVLVEKQAPPTVPFRGPKTRFNVPISAQRRFGGVWLPLDEIRALKDELPGVTVNDVVLEICSGALRQYLEHHSELPDSTLTAMAPISVRASTSEGGNQVSAMLVPLSTDLANPLDRLDEIRKYTEKSKMRAQAIGATALMDAAKVVPFTLGIAASRLYSRMEIAKYVRPIFNLVITNVPGPQRPVHLLGARMLEIYPMVPLAANQAVGIALFSYDGGLYWGFHADWDSMPDLHELVGDLDAEFELT